MQKIAIITDTDSSLPEETTAKYGIRQVPVTINFPDATYTTGVDINDRQLFEKIDQLNKLPTTAAPTPGAFSSAFESAFKAGADGIICMCVSSKVSATYTSATTAAGMFPGKAITVIDSLNLSMGLGFMAIAAAEAAQEGASQDEIVNRALETGKRAHTYVLLSTLKYLAMGGRVGKLTAGMADTLSIKAILTVKEGSLDLLERVRTRKKAMDRMLELATGVIEGKKIECLAFLHINNPEEARELQAHLCAAVLCPPSMMTVEFTPGLSVHGGAGAVGVTILTDR